MMCLCSHANSVVMELKAGRVFLLAIFASLYYASMCSKVCVLSNTSSSSIKLRYCTHEGRYSSDYRTVVEQDEQRVILKGFHVLVRVFLGLRISEFFLTS